MLGHRGFDANAATSVSSDARRTVDNLLPEINIFDVSPLSNWFRAYTEGKEEEAPPTIRTSHRSVPFHFGYARAVARYRIAIFSSPVSSKVNATLSSLSTSSFAGSSLYSCSIIRFRRTAVPDRSITAASGVPDYASRKESPGLFMLAGQKGSGDEFW